MFCTNCGKEIADGSVFCTSCGNRMAQVPAKETVVKADQPDVTSNGQDEIVSNQLTDTVLSDVAEISEKENEYSGVVETSQIPDDVKITPVTVPLANMGPTQVQLVTTPAPTMGIPASATPKKSSGIVIALIAVAVLAAIFLLFNKGSGGYSDYKKLATDYYNAIYKEDVNAMIKLFDKDTQMDMKEEKEDIKDELSDIKETMDDEYEKGWNKKIEAVRRTSNGKSRYAVEIEFDEEPLEILYIKKDDDKFYIDEENTPFY